MDVLLEGILFVLFTFIYTLMGGYFIGSAVSSFKRENWFAFGGNAMLSIFWIVYMVKNVWMR